MFSPAHTVLSVMHHAVMIISFFVVQNLQVQIIPWVISDATYMQDEKSYLDPKKTVFVGALHGMITARV